MKIMNTFRTLQQILSEAQQGPYSPLHFKLHPVEFWEVMCSHKFVRIDQYSGAIENIIFFSWLDHYGPLSPEEIEGFIESKITGIQKDLGINELVDSEVFIA